MRLVLSIMLTNKVSLGISMRMMSGSYTNFQRICKRNPPKMSLKTRNKLTLIKN